MAASAGVHAGEPGRVRAQVGRAALGPLQRPLAVAEVGEQVEVVEVHHVHQFTHRVG
jgi:hypothetical protein